jgi:NAD(P)-dependent dehydrogenase (short-subunit alcohol dehydrogenase family)
MNIIINGGTRGIGRETALRFSDNIDNQVIVTGRNRKALSELAEKSKHKNIISVELDMSEFDNQSDEILKLVSGRFSKIDILINNAGMLIAGDFIRITSSDARKMMETNFLGPATFIRTLEPLMGRGSHIINISSMGGFQGSSKYKGLSYYSASKAALACLSECLAGEFLEKGISVNCLALGSVQTEMLNEAFPGYKAPVSAKEMAVFITDFAMTGSKFFNGKVIPLALGNP